MYFETDSVGYLDLANKIAYVLDLNTNYSITRRERVGNYYHLEFRNTLHNFGIYYRFLATEYTLPDGEIKTMAYPRIDIRYRDDTGSDFHVETSKTFSESEVLFPTFFITDDLFCMHFKSTESGNFTNCIFKYLPYGDSTDFPYPVGMAGVHGSSEDKRIFGLNKVEIEYMFNDVEVLDQYKNNIGSRIYFNNTVMFNSTNNNTSYCIGEIPGFLLSQSNNITNRSKGFFASNQSIKYRAIKLLNDNLFLVGGE